MTCIVFLGCIVAGKSSMAKRLQAINYTPIVPGQLYREAYNQRTDFGIKAHSYWGGGGICPNEMTNELMRQTIESGPKVNLVFDGYPRRVTQAQYLDSLISVGLVVDLHIPDDVAVARLLRRQDNRPDDTEDIIRERLRVYHSNNQAIVDYYATGDRYKLIDADRPKDVVWDEVRSLI